MNMFVLPPDTTGVFHKHDQINQEIHRHYNKSNNELFTSYSTINCEGFMTILSRAWPKWYSGDSLVTAAKRVGITGDRLNVNFMQQDKFDRAAFNMAPPHTPAKSNS